MSHALMLAHALIGTVHLKLVLAEGLINGAIIAIGTGDTNAAEKEITKAREILTEAIQETSRHLPDAASHIAS